MNMKELKVGDRVVHSDGWAGEVIRLDARTANVKRDDGVTGSGLFVPGYGYAWTAHTPELRHETSKVSAAAPVFERLEAALKTKRVEYPVFNDAPARTSAQRKAQPIATGVLAYFPRAMAAIAEHSKRGNDKHNPGEPLHWAREKSTDEADSCVRHIVDALADGPLALDADGGPHLVGAAWRVLAWLERALEGDERWRTVAPAPKAVP
jgi:hypothetical protein